MKYYKIKLDKNGSQLIYPSDYQWQIGDFALDHLYYEDGTQSMLLLILPDKVKNVVRDKIVEITEVEAKAISESKEMRIEKITDEVKLRRIELKIKRGLSLTIDESDALEMQKTNSIFTVEKILADRIDDLKLISE